MGSDLHEKLRAAREAARLTQEQLAKRLGVTRGAVTQWESTNPETRTQPSTKRLHKISEMLDVPAGWFLDHGSTVQDLQFVRQEFRGSQIGTLNVVKTQQHEALPTPPLTTSEPTTEALPRVAQAFFRSAEFEVLRHAPGAERYFDQAIAGVTMHFATSRDIVQFCAPSCDVAAAIGRVLLADRLAGNGLRLHLAFFAPPGASLPKASAALCESAQVKAHTFREPVDAAKFLLSLLKN